jgi:hypothetical protein
VFAQTRYPNLWIEHGWCQDNTHPEIQMIFPQLILSNRWLQENNYHVIRCMKERIRKITLRWMTRRKDFPHVYSKIIEQIPAGSLSRVSWINDVYFKNTPPQENWVITSSLIDVSKSNPA